MSSLLREVHAAEEGLEAGVGGIRNSKRLRKYRFISLGPLALLKRTGVQKDGMSYQRSRYNLGHHWVNRVANRPCLMLCLFQMR